MNKRDSRTTKVIFVKCKICGQRHRVYPAEAVAPYYICEASAFRKRVELQIGNEVYVKDDETNDDLTFLSL